MIESDHDAIEALNEVLAWAKAQPDSSHGGETTGATYQRGRIVATLTHDGTVGMSTYLTVEDAAEKAAEMERGYRNWLALRDSRLIGFGPVTIVDPPEKSGS